MRTKLAGAVMNDTSLRRPSVSSDMRFDAKDLPLFPNADLRRARITARLDGADFSGADLSGADFSPRSERDLGGAPTSGLARCRFTRAKLVGANLTGLTLALSDLRDADLRRANLSGADLSGADLTGAKLTDANLAGAKFDGAVGSSNLAEVPVGRRSGSARRRLLLRGRRGSDDGECGVDLFGRRGGERRRRRKRLGAIQGRQEQCV